MKCIHFRLGVTEGGGVQQYKNTSKKKKNYA